MPDGEFDGPRLRQVLDNLLSNAVKFSKPGTKILIRCGQEGSSARISIVDQGPGISATDLENMFERFQKTGNQPTGGERSTGLGLSIVKNIVDAHDGVITVTSVLGEGTTFTIDLPN